MWRSRALLASILLAVPAAAEACPVCLGAAQGPTIDAARIGVLVMLGITVGVLCAFAMFFRRVARAARDAAAVPRAADAALSPGGIR
ncbi:MAG TPA: hypothetical protein VFX12_10835 [Vicinamibacterales bacterium]|nr:hypothetical protein [Vicinamibacterales bacterium]